MKDRTAKRMALETGETSATLVHAIIREQYGDESYYWDPTTVYLELRADFGVEPVVEVMDRWSAIQTIMTTGGFFDNVGAFLGICNTLATGQPFFDVFDPVTVEEAAWGVTEVALNRELLPFSSSIKIYLRQLLKADGYAPSEYPVALAEVFDKTPDAVDIRADLQEMTASRHNQDNIEEYIEGEIKDMVHQFNEIPSMRDLDDMILRRGLEEHTPK